MKVFELYDLTLPDVSIQDLELAEWSAIAIAWSFICCIVRSFKYQIWISIAQVKYLMHIFAQTQWQGQK